MSRERAPITVQKEGLSYVARAGKKAVGMASAWYDSNDRFVILNVVVSSPFRRRGVATALYSKIEEDAGKPLSPAISLSDDAFEFWKRFRPEAVANDLRHRPELIGQKVEKDGRPGTIIQASGGIATVRYDDANEGEANSQTYIRRRDLDEHLVVDPDGEAQTTAVRPTLSGG